MKKPPPSRSASRTSGSASRTSDGLAEPLVTASFVTMAVMSRVGTGHDLSLSMLRVLGILWDRRPRMAELADYLGLEKQTMSGLVARAESRGLVARAPNAEDGRAMDVFLTRDGVALVKRLRAEGREALAPILERLNPSEQQRLQELLVRLVDTGER